MAGISVTSQHALAQTAYRTGLILETETRALMMALAGTDEESVIVTVDSPGVERGTVMKLRFQGRNRAPMPKGRGATIIGNEGNDDWYEYQFGMGYLTLADRALENAVSDQNEVDFSLKEAAHIGMALDAAGVLESSLVHQLAGYTPVNAAAYTVNGTSYALSGCNACTEPDTESHFFCPDASGANTTETLVAADSTSVLTNRFVDKVLRKKTSRATSTWPMAPAQTPWGRGFVLLCTAEGLEQVKANSTATDIYDLAKACIQGGMPPENSALWTGEGFKINNVFYLSSDWLPLGCSGATAGATNTGTAISNVQRALLLGARAAHLRWGEGYTGGNHLGYTEFIAHRRLSMQMDTVLGAATTIVNSKRWASAVISHYTEATTANALYV
jgi:hypothetical protein